MSNTVVLLWEDMIDEYRKCSDICALTDYGDKKSVRIHNKTVSQMYEIVKIASAKGPSEIEKLAGLLDEKKSTKWIAYQLLEVAELQSKIENKCLKIIESYAKGDDAEAMGASLWLEEWKKKKRRV